MDLRAILTDPDVCPSVAWAALRKAHGEDVDLWEPDAVRLTLDRRGIEPTDALMAKLLGAQTVRTTNVVAFDHDALFAFALACDGVPAAGDAFHHPTVEQLCWAIHEIDRLAARPMSDDEGFDPDEIDPAVAVVLLDEGFVLPPVELAFCRDVLDAISHADPVFRGEVAHAWAPHEHADPAALHRKLADLSESPLHVQLQRLADAKRYVADKERDRDRLNAKL
jgi:hypothetical protein